LVSDVRATWGSGAEQVSEVELILLAGVLPALDRLRMVGKELEKTGPVVDGSRKHARRHPLLRVQAELRGEVAKRFGRLGVSGWSTQNYRVNAAGRFVARREFRGSGPTGRGSGCAEASGPGSTIDIFEGTRWFGFPRQAGTTLGSAPPVGWRHFHARGTMSVHTEGAARPRQEVVVGQRLSTETKQALKTTEFWAYLASVAGVLIASWIVTSGNGGQDGDAFNASRAWLYVAILTVGYTVSRGLAKSGVREPAGDDDRR
jgi:hypothetical protein